MDRPTCATCPYFLLLFPKLPDVPQGLCHLEPVEVEKTSWQFCSHHPDFPAYIASLKNNPNPTVDPDEVLIAWDKGRKDNQ